MLDDTEFTGVIVPAYPAQQHLEARDSESQRW